MKIVVLSRRLVTGALCLALAVGIFWLVDHPEAVGAAAMERQIPIYCVQREEKLAALTFDAAWGNEDTEMLISILDRYQVPATFFLVGEWVEKFPQSVQALHEAGHSIQNHSATHPYLTKCSAQQLKEEIEGCNDLVEEVTGVRPTLLRCPYGDYNDTVVQTIRSLGMEAIQWDVDSLDWKDLSAGEITERVLSAVEPGSIVLFHNAAPHTPEALPGIIETLQADGYRLVTVGELLLDGEWTVDHAGRQCP
ncbi:MAG: polysaccharide deacetylase family protein [Oscillospiraceae bacterium]|nr:polysaccharide deacetylase family protein [Oscillospiraceae bacterium]